MARRNSACRSQCRGPQYMAPAPLYSRVEDLRPASPAPPAPASAPARAALADAEVRMCRYPSSLPTQAEREELCLLRRQNALLAEILAALNARRCGGTAQR